MPLPELVVATHNAGKLDEFRSLLAGLVLMVRGAGELGLVAPEETGITFAENALLKARAVHFATGLPALADDSGICLAGAQGWPGVMTASFSNRAEGLAEMNKRRSDNPVASCHCTLALVGLGPEELIFEGQVDGIFIWPGRGDGGFGYDQHFIPAGQAQTYAEMGKVMKNSLSHRAKAFTKLRDYLANN